MTNADPDNQEFYKCKWPDCDYISPTNRGRSIHRAKLHEADEPWHTRDVLYRMYHEKGMSADEIADEFGCSQGAILDAMERNSVETRSLKQAQTVRRPYAQHYFTGEGYERVATEIDDEKVSTSVHKLVAIAHGADPHKVFSDDYIVHHEDGIRWNNSPDNLYLMDRVSHAVMHVADQKRDPEEGHYV